MGGQDLRITKGKISADLDREQDGSEGQDDEERRALVVRRRRNAWCLLFAFASSSLVVSIRIFLLAHVL